MQSLVKGKDFFKAQQVYILYLYIYIYIYMKANKGVVKIKFCYPVFACERKL